MKAMFGIFDPIYLVILLFLSETVVTMYIPTSTRVQQNSHSNIFCVILA